MKSIYLDINGVIEYQDSIIPGFREFLLKVIDTHKVYWLTTHCNGDAENPVKYLMRFTDDEEFIAALRKILPTKWDFIKSEGIDYSEDFVWYDDKPLSLNEERYMEERGGSGRLRLVDLDKVPGFWWEEVETFGINIHPNI